MTLEAVVRYHVGTLTLAIDLIVGDEIVAVLGPNGAGKTTLLRTLSGLSPIDDGRIVLDDKVLDEPAARIFVRPRDRSIGVTFQDYLLFPFLTVRENVAFGLRSRGTARKLALQRADEWLSRVGLGALGDLHPGELSGGQAQRVALARAVVTEPHLLLLDEPLAALDAGARIDIRRELREHLGQIHGARLIVTHDPVDASALADRVIIVEEGKIVQEGLMSEIALHPRSSYVADLVGLNLLRGIASDGTVRLEHGGEIRIAEHAINGAVCLAIHPRAVTILLGESAGSARNHWQGHVTDLDNLGERVRVQIDGPVPIVAEVTPEAARDLHLVAGCQVVVALKATEVQVYPA